MRNFNKSNAYSKNIKLTTEDPELADRFNKVLNDTVEAMEEGGIRYVFIGGIASGGLGRPRSTHDIDLFVMPEDAELALRALAKKGFKTEKTDPSWLYKGFKEDILVDVIFKSKGEIYLDPEMYQRVTTAEFHGKRLRLVSPEDLLIIKVAAHSELTPSHWHDAVALLSHASIDWEYLLKRAKRAPRRVLSLLLYAQSNDIWVPNHIIHNLYTGLFGDVSKKTISLPPKEEVPMKTSTIEGPLLSKGKVKYAYALAHLKEMLAGDPRVSELDIQVEESENKIYLKGEVTALEKKQKVEQLAKEKFPECFIENQIRVLKITMANELEEYL